jgi:hypothetical protein
MPNVDRKFWPYSIHNLQKENLWSDPMANIQIKKSHMILQNNSFAKSYKLHKVGCDFKSWFLQKIKAQQ